MNKPETQFSTEQLRGILDLWRRADLNAYLCLGSGGQQKEKGRSQKRLEHGHSILGCKVEASRIAQPRFVLSRIIRCNRERSSSVGFQQNRSAYSMP